MLSTFISKLLLARQFTLTDKEFKIFDKGFYLQPLKQLAFLQKKLEKKFGQEGLNCLYEVSKQSFFEMSKDLEKFSQTRNVFLNVLSVFIQHLGFGKVEIVEVKNEEYKAKVKVKDNPFAKEYIKLFKIQKKSIDYLLAGIIAGYFSTYFQKEVSCKEERCMGKGNLACEFTISP